MPESLGARLRHERERQHIALATITEHTKIKQSLLDALERDDVSHWPGGIFRRAYIRAYAQAIGLDPDTIVREFLQFHPDPNDVVEPEPTAAPGVDGERTSRPPMRLQYVVESAIGSLSSRWSGSTRRSSTITDPTPIAINPHPGPRDDEFATSSSVGDIDSALVKNQAPTEPDLAAAADVCTAFGRAASTDEAAPLLREAGRILDAIGLIVWVWDPQAARLKPVLAHGYSDRVLAQIPALGRDADNATAAAFRLEQPCAVESRDTASGALVVPLMTAAGCAGVLAMELQHGSEQTPSVRALATIFASQLARLIGPAANRAEVEDRRLA